MSTLTVGRSSPLLLGSAATLSLLAALAPHVAAQEVISDTRTEGVLTSVTGDLTIDEDGAFELDDGTAITVDSDATVVNNGTILYPAETAADGSRGVFVTPGAGTFSYTQGSSGRITLNDDDPNDDDLPPPYADDRFGFLLSAGAYTGDVTFEDGSQVTVIGDASGGIILNGNLDGNFSSGAGVVMTGANSTGVQVSGVTGDVTFSSEAAVVANGESSTGIAVTGPVGGAVTFGGSVQSSGYQRASTAAAPTVDSPEDNDNFDQAGFQAGDALFIGGDVAGGVLLDGPLPSEFSAVEGQATSSATVSMLGNGNGVRIDGEGSPITLGPVDATGIEDAEANPYGAYGFINRGQIVARGIFGETVDYATDTEGNVQFDADGEPVVIATRPGVPAQAVFVDDATIEGGIRNDGVIDSLALDAAATGLRLGGGATVPVLYNRGTVTVVGRGDGASSEAIVVEAGGSLSELTNTGLIEAATLSDDGSGTAILDAGGSLTRITNSGTIAATAVPENVAETTGVATAIDLSANTTGVTIENTTGPLFDEETDSRANFGVVIGRIVTGSGGDSYLASAGRTIGDVDLGDGDNTLALSGGATLTGDVRFGTGTDSASLDDATLTGNVDFGSGGGSLSLVNGAALIGGIIGGSGVDASLAEATLTIPTAQTATLGSLTTTADSSLIFTVNEDGTAISSITAGAATLADGTGISTLFTGAFAGDVSATIIATDGLTADLSALVVDNEGTTPFLFSPSLALSDGGTDLDLTLRRKTADELGLSDGFAPAYEPIIAAVVTASDSGDPDAGLLLFNARSQRVFDQSFRQFLPVPLDGALTYARAQNNSITSIINQRTDRYVSYGDGKPHFWLQEGTYFVNRESTADSNGFDGGGFVIAGGADMPFGGFDIFGIAAHFASARFDEQEGQDFPVDRLSYGFDVYGSKRVGNLQMDYRSGFALSNSDSERNILIDTNLRQFEGEWDGTQLSSNARVRYDIDTERARVTPFLAMDYLRLKEDSYLEKGDDVLRLAVDDREAESLRANVGVELSRSFVLDQGRYEFNRPGTFRPRLLAAWSQELITDDLESRYQFPTGDPFTLSTETESSAAIVGADISYENDYATVHFGGSGTFGEVSETYQLRAAIGLKW
ncbi:hypothetical protein PB2503_05277 [Parvularcula bermudensis HTCC2503]|uniref:Autotransporter domain-containing protein n=1 Tax=Parvularcula bermudensis (strain ATCC BAA-594 / HTCC2503 / KCTC 12087) TaxID=314260 RepID=E0TG87_PARBH|nr:autotransporter outer membrane beta-barrel domain-containing protein [Parvularcula bermudensis]ADM09130.1 hypothetical protein PB2503_05277 [Parvularcula bermudensis HTCC2503]